MKKRSIYIALGALLSFSLSAQTDHPQYTGTTLANVDYTHGQLTPAVGVHNIQVIRANRENPMEGEGLGYTYHHAPMIAYWNNTYYVQWIGGAVGEHIPPSQSFLITSKDGYVWEKPTVVFPEYKLPFALKKPNIEGEAKSGQGAIMHQRMAFYTTKAGKLLVTGFYGYTIHEDSDMPNDGTGLMRVVREIRKDGSMGEIFVLKYNPGFTEKNITAFKFYKRSRDLSFVRACDELLNNHLVTQQWNEENFRNDPKITLPIGIKALSYYHLKDGRVVAVGKRAATAISSNQGKTWSDVTPAPGVYTGSAKVWAQRTADNRYAWVYDASQFRWPMAVITGDDGLTFDTMLLLQGEISPKRYAGQWKDYGPQYFRGIVEGNGTPPDGKMWITYSMNKEDIWVASVTTPITSVVEKHGFDDINFVKHLSALNTWNIHSPLWASVSLTESDGQRWISLKDKDRYEYAKAERIFPESKRFKVGFLVRPTTLGDEPLLVELQDAKGTAAISIEFALNNQIQIKTNDEPIVIGNYELGKDYDIELTVECQTMRYSVNVNGPEARKGILFTQPVHTLQRLVFRTGHVRRAPHPDSPVNRTDDLPQAGEFTKESNHLIRQIFTESL